MNTHKGPDVTVLGHGNVCVPLRFGGKGYVINASAAAGRVLTGNGTRPGSREGGQWRGP